MPGQKTGIGVANNPNVKVIRVELPIATSSSSISNSATGNTLQPVYVPADLGEIFVQDTDKSSEHLQVPIENINASEELPHHGGQEETVVMEAPDIHTIGAEEMAQDITQQVVVNTGQLEPNVNSVSELSSLGGTQTVVISAPQGSHQVSLEGLPIQLSQLASGQTFQILSAGGSDASAGGTASVVRTTPAVKRQLTSMGASSNPNVTKVIITKNPNASQPGTMLTQSQLQNLNLTSMMPGVSVLPAPASPQKQAKTITISTQGILSPLTGSRPMTSVLSSPAKLISKIPISPSKTPTKITMIPISKTPTKITPGSGQVSILSMASGAEGGMLGNASSATASSQPVSIVTMSPTKLKPTVQQRQTISLGGTPVSLQSGASGTIKQIALPIGQTVQGSKFQYVRLVTPSSQAKSNPQLTSLVQPKTLTSLPTGSQQPQLITISGSQIGKSGQPLQRIILPAPSQTIRQISSATTLQSIRPAITSTLAQLSGGTILSSGGVSGSLQGYAIVPASYVTQLQSQTISSSKSDTMHPQELPSVPPPQPIIHPAPPPTSKEFVPIASNDPFVSASALARTVLNGVSPTTAIEPTGARPRKPCNCTKSQCLKLYCDCFANGEFCHNCNCTNCANNLDHEEERSKAIKSCLDRNPMAFHPKIGSGKGKEGDGDRRHNKGCNCKRSGCLKNYCECYEAKIMCSSFCKCIGCKNFEESPERKTLMHLADAAEVREQQQVAAKTKLSSQISGVPTRPPISVTGERLPYTFITSEVAEATCACLLAQAEEAERLKMPPVVQERMVIEEFGRCLMQIIESAQKTRDEAES